MTDTTPTPDRPPIDVTNLAGLQHDLEVRREAVLTEIGEAQQTKEQVFAKLRELRAELETADRLLRSFTPRKRTRKATVTNITPAKRRGRQATSE